MQPAEKKQVLPLLDELRGAVEELLLAGLTTVSKSTIERMDVTFREVSRLRLLRLGSTLRIANEEISRFSANSTQFSPRRLAFFLGRTWLLATGMRRAIERDDDAQLDRLLWTPPAQAVEAVSVVTLGVSKRVVAGAFATFEFRLRAIDKTNTPEPLIWSCVFPMRKDLDLPAEAFLHLPQKQKFRPSMLLEKKIVHVTSCAIARSPTAPGRLVLTDNSQLASGKAFDGWSSLWKWNPSASLAKLEKHRPTPLDLDVELQEEVFLDRWEPGEKQGGDEGYDTLPLSEGPFEFEARLDRGPSGQPLNGVMTTLAAKKKRPPLFGAVHYEACRMLLQPLAVLGKDGPEYLTISPDKISQAELVKAMKFT